MDYKMHTLSSGLKVLISEVPSLESITLTIWVKTGSRNEEKRVNGISHFLEHMVIKGSAKRPLPGQVNEAIDAIGGEFNAGTSKEWTNFYIKTRAGSIETGFDILSDMVFNPLLKPSEIEKEKGTIIQEIAMYEDTPMMHIGDVFEELVFSGNSLGWDTAGSPTTVRSIYRKDFVNYREKFYHFDNILISISGGITEKEALKLVDKYFSKFKEAKSQEFVQSERFIVTQKSPRFKLKNKENEQAHLMLGFMSEGRGYKGKYAQGILSTILGSGMSSRLFVEIRQKRGLAYVVRSANDRYQEVGYVGVHAGVDVKKADEAVKVILDQYYGIANKNLPISNNEMTKAKEYLKGHIALSLEDTQAVGDFFAEQALFLDKILTPEQIYKKIDAVTIDEVYFEAVKLFKPEKLNLAIIGPFKDGEKFKKLLN